MFCMTSTSLVALILLVVAVNWTVSIQASEQDIKRWTGMHENYDRLGNSDGFVAFSEISRALGGTTEEDWNNEIAPHDDGDNLLTLTEFQNWLHSFKKDEL